MPAFVTQQGGAPQPAGVQAFGNATNRLTIENLYHHTLSTEQLRTDLEYVYTVIGGEQASREDETLIIRFFGSQAEHHCLDGSTNSSGAMRAQSIVNSTTIVEAARLYSPPRPSSMSPLQRFITLSPKHDPYVTFARTEMRECGIGFGDMHSAQKRLAAAESIEEETRRQAVHTIIPSRSGKYRIQKSIKRLRPTRSRSSRSSLDKENLGCCVQELGSQAAAQVVAACPFCRRHK